METLTGLKAKQYTGAIIIKSSDPSEKRFASR